MAATTVKTNVYTSKRLFPSTPVLQPIEAPLSIVDSTVLTFYPSTAIWIYKLPPGSEEYNLLRTLETSLAATLNSYPHFSGQLSLNNYPGGPNAPHTERFRRCKILYGFPTDPGVLFETANVPLRVEDICREPRARTSTSLCWDVTSIKFSELFIPNERISGTNLSADPGASNVQIRVTGFLGFSGLAIGIRITHCLADAQALVTFANSWGQMTRAQLNRAPLQMLIPVFQPDLLDVIASGDIDAATPDESLLAHAQSLPLHRYDWWEHGPAIGGALDLSPQAVIPSELPREVIESRTRGFRIPWEEWNAKDPVANFVLHVSAKEVDDLYQKVGLEDQAAFGVSNAPDKLSCFSRHDVLLAFLWQILAISRSELAELDSDDSNISIDMTLGLRPRLGLPASFLGSPILLAGLSAPYISVTGLAGLQESGDAIRFPDIKALAGATNRIRSHIQAFDKTSLTAWLHEMAFEVSPQRIWNGFIGKRHLMVTSWVRSGLWDVDFGLCACRVGDQRSQGQECSGGLLLALPLMPLLDGVAVITEASGREDQGQGWWRGGVDVNINLESETMARVVRILKTWRGKIEDL